MLCFNPLSAEMSSLPSASFGSSISKAWLTVDTEDTIEVRMTGQLVCERCVCVTPRLMAWVLTGAQLWSIFSQSCLDTRTRSYCQHCPLPRIPVLITRRVSPHGGLEERHAIGVVSEQVH